MSLKCITAFIHKSIETFCTLSIWNESVCKVIKLMYIAAKNKTKDDETADSVITSRDKPSRLPCFHIPFQIMLTKGEGQAVAPLSPPLWEPQDQHMLQSWALRLTMAPTQTRIDTLRRVFVLAGSHTPSYQLWRYIIVHCEDWGEGPTIPPPSTATSLVFGSLGAICICCLTLNSRESKPHEVMWLQLLGE